MEKIYTGVLLLLLSTFGYSLLPIFTVFAYKYDITMYTLLFIRFLPASIIFFFFARVGNGLSGVTRKNIFYFFILGGVIFTLQSSLYFSSLKYISPSLAVLIFYTYPLFVSLISTLIFKEPLTRWTLLSMGLSFIGMLIMMGNGIGGINFYGMFLALSTAVVYSIYIIFSNHVLKQSAPIVTSSFVTLFASMGVLVLGLTTGSMNFMFQVKALLPVAGIILISTVLPMITFFKSLDILGPTKVSILGMTEPIFTVVFSILIFREHITFYQLCGGTIVIAAAVLLVLTQRKQSTAQV